MNDNSNTKKAFLESDAAQLEMNARKDTQRRRAAEIREHANCKQNFLYYFFFVLFIHFAHLFYFDFWFSS